VNCGWSLSETIPCNEDPCDVDCKLGDWTPFADGPCSATCGEGTMVERRRVVEGPVGNGKLCPPWDQASGPDARVKFSDCRATVACQPRCDPAPAAAMDASLFGACSDVCDASKFDARKAGRPKVRGHRSVMRVAKRKEFAATIETCGLKEDDKKPCGISCRYVNFFPANGKLPRLGKWADIVLVMFLSVAAESFHLYAPKGFEIAKNEDDKCLLKSHNLPRLKECKVTTARDGRPMAIFSLWNPLENWYWNTEGEVYRPRYEVRFWAKSPATCGGGVDDAGACKDSNDKWLWDVWFKDNEMDTTEIQADNRGGYNVYDSRARESAWEPIKIISDTRETQEAMDWADALEKNADVSDSFGKRGDPNEAQGHAETHTQEDQDDIGTHHNSDDSSFA